MLRSAYQIGDCRFISTYEQLELNVCRDKALEFSCRESFVDLNEIGGLKVGSIASIAESIKLFWWRSDCKGTVFLGELKESSFKKGDTYKSPLIEFSAPSVHVRFGELISNPSTEYLLKLQGALNIAIALQDEAFRTKCVANPSNLCVAGRILVVEELREPPTPAWKFGDDPELANY